MPRLTSRLIEQFSAALLSSLLPWEFSAIEETDSLLSLSEQERTNGRLVHPFLKRTVLQQQMAVRGKG